MIIELKQTIEIILIIVFAIWILSEVFNINALRLANEYGIANTAVGIWLLYCIHDGKVVCELVGQDNFIEEIEECRLCNSIQDELEYWKVWEKEKYDNLSTKLDLLKSFAPVSLISLIAGYLIEHSEEVEIEWNAYLIIFVIIIGWFIFEIVNTYEKMKMRRKMLTKLEQKQISIRDKEDTHKETFLYEEPYVKIK